MFSRADIIPICYQIIIPQRSLQFEHLTDDQWQATFDLTLLSAVRLIRSVLPSMRQRQGGRIIHIVSSSVKQLIQGLLLSNAIRPGIIGLAKTLSVELAPYQITVNNVCPGRILTDRLRQGRNVLARVAQGMGEEEASHEGLRQGATDGPSPVGSAQSEYGKPFV